MNYKRFLGAASTALIIVIAIFTLALGARAQSKFKTLHQFTGGKDGSAPVASLIFDQAGNLYGTTQHGGAQGLGVVFKMTPSTDGSWKEKVLHEFTGGDDGSNPSAGLIFGQTGNLYGTTASGGAHGGGVVFQLLPVARGLGSEHPALSGRRDC